MPAPVPSQLKKYNVGKQRGDNRYRFQGFNERINNIHLSLAHHRSIYQHADEDLLLSSTQSSSPAADIESHFQTELIKQRELDGSNIFTQAYRQLRPLSRNFPLVIHHKQKIIQILIQHLIQHSESHQRLPITTGTLSTISVSSSDVSSSLANTTSNPQPYLLLIAALARDLRYDIYPYFPYILTNLFSIINPYHAEHLEHLFTCIIFLFRFLSKHLINDFQSLFISFFTLLLRHDRWYIRKLSAEVLAYLVRKVQKQQRIAVYSTILNTPQETDKPKQQQERQQQRSQEEKMNNDSTNEMGDLHLPPILKTRVLNIGEYRDGISSLLFYIHKNVNHTFHSITSDTLPILLSFLHPLSESIESLSLSAYQTEIIVSFFRRLANYTRAEAAIIIWQSLSQQLTYSLQQYKQLIATSSTDDNKKEDILVQLRNTSLELSRLCSIVHMWISFRQGSRISDIVLITQMIQQMMEEWIFYHPLQSDSYRTAALSCLAAFFSLSKFQVHHHQIQPILTRLFTLSPKPLVTLSPSLLLPLVQTLHQNAILSPLVLRHSFSYLMAFLSSSERKESSIEHIDDIDWLNLFLTVCQDYHQYDDFYYADRRRQQLNEFITEANIKDPPIKQQHMMITVPSVIIQRSVLIIADTMLPSSSVSQSPASTPISFFSLVSAAMQSITLSSLTTVDDISSYLHPQHIALMRQLMPFHSDSDDDILSIHHLLFAFSRYAENVISSLSYPSHPRLIDLFSETVPTSSFPAPLCTTAVIDQWLYLRARGLISSHLLFCNVTSSMNVDLGNGMVTLLQHQWQNCHQLTKLYVAHPAVLRPTLSFLHLNQHIKESLTQQTAMVGQMKEKKKQTKKKVSFSTAAAQESLSCLYRQIFCDESNEEFIGLLSPILSHPTASIRILVLEILCCLGSTKASSSVTSSFSNSSLLDQLLSLMSLSISYDNEKRFETQLKQWEVFILSQRIPSIYIPLLFHSLLGLLHLKMSSVWTSTQKCLSIMMQLHGDIVWPVWLAALKRNAYETRVVVTAKEKDEMEGQYEKNDEQRMEEDMKPIILADEILQDPLDDSREEEEEEEEEADVDNEDSFASSNTENGSSAPSTLSGLFESFSHVSGDSTDVYTLHSLLNKTMTLDEARNFTNRHAARLSSLFLLFWYHEYERVYQIMTPVKRTMILEDDAQQQQQQQQPEPRLASDSFILIPSARKIAKNKLLHFLRMFNASFNNLTRLQHYRLFFPYFFYQLLVHSDTDIQTLSLQCLAKYQYPFLMPYTTTLNKFINETQYREEMTIFHLSPSASVVPLEFRYPLATFIIRILYPKLMLRKLSHNKTSLSARRAAILAFLAGLEHSELKELFVILTIPFKQILDRASDADLIEDQDQQIKASQQKKQSKQEIQEEDMRVIREEYSVLLPMIRSDFISQAIYANYSSDGDIAINQQLGFLKLLEVLLDQMRRVLQPYLPHLLLIMLHMLKRCNERIEGYKQRRSISVSGNGVSDESQSMLDDAQDRYENELKDDDNREPLSSEEAYSDQVLLDDDENREKREQADLRSIRQLIFSRFATIFDFYHLHFFPSSITQSTSQTISSDMESSSVVMDLTPYLYHFLSLSSSSISLLAAEQTQHKGGLLRSLVIMSKHPTLLPTLLSPDPIPAHTGLPSISPLFPSLLALLSAKHVASNVISGVLDICDNLIQREDEAKEVLGEEERERTAHQRVAQREQDISSVKVGSAMLDSSDEEVEAEELKSRTKKKPQLALNEESQRLQGQDRSAEKRIATLVSCAWNRYIGLFLHHMHQHIYTKPTTSSTTSSSRFFPRRELSIIASVSCYANDESAAIKLIDLLLRYLAHTTEARNQDKRRPQQRVEYSRSGRMIGTESIQYHLLTIIRDCIALINHPSNVASSLPRHFAAITSNTNRSILASIFNIMAKRLSYLQPVALLLTSMTAVMNSRVDEPDYDNVLAAYNIYLTAELPNFTIQQHIPLVYLMLRHLYDEELGIRGQALHTLKELCTNIQQNLDGQVDENPGEIITSIIYPAIRKALKSAGEIVRREHLSLLSHLIISFPRYFSAFQSLSDENPDLDFFVNISHVQTHRKQKALIRLVPLINEQKINALVAIDVLLPLARHIIEESGGQGKSAVKYRGLRAGDADIDIGDIEDIQRKAQKMRKSANNTIGVDMAILDTSILVIGSLSSLLSWHHYYSLLLSFVKALNQRDELQRLLVRVVCNIVDHWHFRILEGSEMNQQEKEEEAARLGEQPKKRLAPIGNAATDTIVIATREGEEKEGPSSLISDKDIEDEEIDQIADRDREIADMDSLRSHDAVDVSDSWSSQSSFLKHRVLALRIRSTLSQHLLPHLHTLMTGTSKGDTFALLRTPVALAIVKLLQKLPDDFFELHFPRLITALLTQMQRREQDARDIARKVIVDTIVMIGPAYLAAVISESVLMLSRGYQRHVLGYLVYSIVDRLASEQIPVGSIDDCIVDIMKIVMNELVGEIAQEKTVDQIKRSGKEARGNKAADIVERLSQLVTFTKLALIIHPLRDVLLSSTSHTVIKDIREVLRRVVEGVMKNRSLDVKQLLIFVYRTMKEVTDGGTTTDAGKPSTADKTEDRLIGDDDGEDDDQAIVSDRDRVLRYRISKDSTFSIQKLSNSQSISSSSSRSLSTHHNQPILLHFALSLLHDALRTHKIVEHEAGMREMLDPYLHLLSDCCLMMKKSSIGIEQESQTIKGRSDLISNDVIISSLKVANYFLRFTSLPSLKGFVGPFIDLLFNLLTSDHTDLYPAIFKTLSIIIHHCPTVKLNTQHLTLLLSFIAEDVLKPNKQTVIFNLLHAILSRKFLLAQLYDIMTNVSQLMVTSYNEGIQKECANLFLLFLLDYPMSEKRLRQHFTFLIQNLSYPQPTGRLMLLSLLSSVFYRFPSVILDEHIELLFFPLLCVLINDENADCRIKTAESLNMLINKLSHEKQLTVIGWVHTWLQHDTTVAMHNAVLLRRSAAAQCYGMLVTIMGHRFIPYLDDLMNEVKNIFQDEQHRLDEKKKEKDRGNNTEKAKAAAAVAEEQYNDAAAAEEDPQRLTQISSSDVNTNHDHWQLLYFILLLLAKSLIIDTDNVDQTNAAISNTTSTSNRLSAAVIHAIDDRNLLPTVIFFLLHPHSWVRAAATRVLFGYLQTDRSLPAAIILRLFKISAMQLDNVYLKEKMGLTVINNLLILSKMTLQTDWHTTTTTTIEQQESSLQIDGSTIEEEEEEDAANNNTTNPTVSHLLSLVDMGLKNRGLNWLFHRLSYMARSANDITRHCILGYFHHIINAFPINTYSPYLLSIINPLYSIASHVLAYPNLQAEKNKEQAAALLELLQSKIGTPIFLEYYQYVRSAITKKKAERLNAKKRLAVSAPDIYARMKQQKHHKNRVLKKRKMEGIKLARGIPGVGAAGIQLPRRPIPMKSQNKRSKVEGSAQKYGSADEM